LDDPRQIGSLNRPAQNRITSQTLDRGFETLNRRSLNPIGRFEEEEQDHQIE